MVTLDNYNEICAIYLTLIEDLKGGNQSRDDFCPALLFIIIINVFTKGVCHGKKRNRVQTILIRLKRCKISMNIKSIKLMLIVHT